MSATLFFDTETTGRVQKWDAPPSDPSHPMPVQLAAILRDDDSLKEISSLNVIIRPEGWVIEDGAAKVHGISQEYATKYGISLENATWAFMGMLNAADMVVAHNLRFDATVMRRAAHVADVPDIFGEKSPRCTMLASIPIVRILHKRPRHPTDFKYPKLDEAMMYFFNTGVGDDAHDALVDVRACIRVHDELQKMKAFPDQKVAA